MFYNFREEELKGISERMRAKERELRRSRYDNSNSRSRSRSPRGSRSPSSRHHSQSNRNITNIYGIAHFIKSLK